MAEHAAAERVDRALVGAAVDECGVHPLDERRVGWPGRREHSADPAHRRPDLGGVMRFRNGPTLCVVSCHVERPLDDRCWDAFARFQAARPGGFEIAALMRPPDAGGGRERVALARAGADRGARRRRSATTRTGAGRSRRARRAATRPSACARGGVAARARPRAAALLRRRLVHGRGGRRRARRARLRRLHRDRVPAVVPAGGRSAPLPRASRAWLHVGHATAARAADHALARDGRSAPRSGRSRPTSTSTSTTPTCSTGAAAAPSRPPSGSWVAAGGRPSSRR